MTSMIQLLMYEINQSYAQTTYTNRHEFTSSRTYFVHIRTRKQLKDRRRIYFRN